MALQHPLPWCSHCQDEFPADSVGTVYKPPKGGPTLTLCMVCLKSKQFTDRAAKRGEQQRLRAKLDETKAEEAKLSAPTDPHERIRRSDAPLSSRAPGVTYSPKQGADVLSLMQRQAARYRRRIY